MAGGSENPRMYQISWTVFTLPPYGTGASLFEAPFVFWIINYLLFIIDNSFLLIRFV